MAEDDSQDRTTHFSDGVSRSRGLLRRLMDGLRGTTQPAGRDPERLGRYRILHRLGQGGMGMAGGEALLGAAG